MKSRSILLNLILGLLAVVAVLPLIWTVVSSLKQSNIEIFTHPFNPPAHPVVTNYARAYHEGRMGEYFFNSGMVAGLTTLLTVVLGTWAGFALSKQRFPGRRLWLALFLVGMILPVQSYLIPLADVLRTLNLHDSLWALILPYTAQSLPLSVLLFAAYFQALPAEIEEAARLDGVPSWRFYFGILLPVARPVVGTVVILTWLNSWNEFLMAMLYIVNPALRTLPAGMIAFEQSHNTDYPALLAGLTMICLPALAMYAVFNRRIVQGVVAGTLR